LLNGVGISDDDGEVRFQLKRDDRHSGLYMITRSFRAARDLSATVAGQEIPLQRGEHIGLNFQYTYTREGFLWLLAEHGGLEILEEHLSADGRFLTAICRRG
jgi:hypothetical protein